MANGVFHHQSTPAQPNAETLICRNSLSYIDNIIAQEEPYPNQFAVVLADGQTKRFKDFFAVQPQPGDTIIVPRRTVTPATLRNTRDIVQIIFQGVSSLGIIAALLASL